LACHQSRIRTAEAYGIGHNFLAGLCRTAERYQRPVDVRQPGRTGQAGIVAFTVSPAGRVSPKNARPFHRVPVTATAMALSEGSLWFSIPEARMASASTRTVFPFHSLVRSVPW